MKNRKALSLGFTLIELLVTIVIIGVLAAMAIPSYFNSVRKTNRTDATIGLMDAAQRLQKCYTIYGSYIVSPNNNSCAVFTELNVTGGKITDKKYYKIEFDLPAPTQSTFALKATAILAPQTKDITACQKLTLTQNGTKGDATSTATSPTTCW